MSEIKNVEIPMLLNKIDKMEAKSIETLREITAAKIKYEPKKSRLAMFLSVLIAVAVADGLAFAAWKLFGIGDIRIILMLHLFATVAGVFTGLFIGSRLKAKYKKETQDAYDDYARQRTGFRKSVALLLALQKAQGIGDEKYTLVNFSMSNKVVTVTYYKDADPKKQHITLEVPYERLSAEQAMEAGSDYILVFRTTKVLGYNAQEGIEEDTEATSMEELARS